MELISVLTPTALNDIQIYLDDLKLDTSKFTIEIPSIHQSIIVLN